MIRRSFLFEPLAGSQDGRVKSCGGLTELPPIYLAATNGLPRHGDIWLNHNNEFNH